MYDIFIYYITPPERQFSLLSRYQFNRHFTRGLFSLLLDFMCCACEEDKRLPTIGLTYTMNSRKSVRQ